MSKVIFNMSSVPVPMGLYHFFDKNINKALVVQQIHYWCEISKNSGDEYKFRDGHYWTYMTLDELSDQLPVSKSTIRRVLKELEEAGYIVVGNYNKAGYDRTKWYRVDYVKLESELKVNGINKCSNEHMDMSKRTHGDVQMNTTIPKSSSKTSSETSTKRYITLTSDDNKGSQVHFMKMYNDMYRLHKQKEHPAIEYSQLQELHNKLDALIDRYQLTDTDLHDIIELHFNELPSDNDGKIQYLLSGNDTQSVFIRHLNVLGIV